MLLAEDADLVQQVRTARRIDRIKYGVGILQ